MTNTPNKLRRIADEMEIGWSGPGMRPESRTCRDAAEELEKLRAVTDTKAKVS